MTLTPKEKIALPTAVLLGAVFGFLSVTAGYAGVFLQSIPRDLLAKGADVNAKDAAGKTAEDWAIYYKHERFAEQLKSLQGSAPKVQ